MTSPAVNIVIAAGDAASTIRACLTETLRQAGEVGASVTVADASADGTADIVAAEFPSVTLLRRPTTTLTPELWRDGLQAGLSSPPHSPPWGRGGGAGDGSGSAVAPPHPFVVLSTAQMVPEPGWLSALLQRAATGTWAGVGGCIDPAPGLCRVDTAAYLLRYTRYMTPVGEAETHDIPGDNALYATAPLAACGDLLTAGFWEPEIHRRLFRDGGRLLLTPAATVRFVGGVGLGRFLRERFRHGRRFGADRAAREGWVLRLVRAAAAPLVPAIYLAKILGNLRRKGRMLGAFAWSLPVLTLVLTAWAAGEALGGLFGGGLFGPGRRESP